MLNAAKQYVATRNIIDATFDDYVRTFLADEELLARWIELKTDRDLLRSEIKQAIFEATFQDPIKSKILAIAGELVQAEDIIQALNL